MNTFKIYLTLATIALLSIGNTNQSFGRNTQKIYKNIVEDKASRSTSIYFYKGQNDLNIKPTKYYSIKYNTNNKPIEKIRYDWDTRTQEWTISAKYNYSYLANGEIDTLKYSEWNNKTERWDNAKEFSILDLDISKELLTMHE